jgi:hypothetical protein
MVSQLYKISYYYGVVFLNLESLANDHKCLDFEVLRLDFEISYVDNTDYKTNEFLILFNKIKFTIY